MKTVQNSSFSALPKFVNVNNVQVNDKKDIVDLFNNHFASAGSLFKPGLGHLSSPGFSNANVWDSNLFTFEPISRAKVLLVLQNINCKRSAGPDGLDHFLLKLVANIIVEPITYIFNLSFEKNIIPLSWKTGHARPLFKNGDPTIMDNYRPISKLSVLAKIF